AADILLYDADQVPVGDDQNQHLELTRTIATRFNARYGETFVVPEGVRPESAARIMDLAEPTRKMSKSSATAAGRIGLLDPPEAIRKAVSRAVTDAVGVVRHDPERQPGVSNLLAILAECTGEQPGAYPNYGTLKRDVSEAVDTLLAPIRKRHAELADDPTYVREILAEG